MNIGIDDRRWFIDFELGGMTLGWWVDYRIGR